jgi:hypothetical protein
LIDLVSEPLSCVNRHIIIDSMCNS